MAPPRVRELGEMYELVEEVLIRIPPDDPAGLIRASLVCKAWCGLVSGHAFRSHYRVFHKTPPILGFLQSWEEEGQRFVPTTRFRPRNCKPLDSSVLDCRHGRVLLMCYYDGYADADENEEEDYYEEYEAMVVWDPLSGRRTKLHNPDIFNPLINGTNYSATVLCAADGCNHDACNLAPFLVAFVVLESSDSLWLVGCVEGTDILVVATDIGAFTIDLKSLRSRKLSSKPFEDIC
ncbi:uncharacterized protein LOC125507172 [Triticum urartu]|uniref:uncharacterized protein LOC125507172 n=1 Tax=Triticum urartu TaxID=4572 RepID=UPI0020431DBD|nr:uncharacterized protein LOC125507172 [Triticum urartu]